MIVEMQRRDKIKRNVETKAWEKISSAGPAFADSAVAKVSSGRQRSGSQPFPACPALPIARCIDMGFPSGNAYFGRAAPNAVPERSICQNRRRTFRTRAAGCHRRGNALRPSAPKRRNIGPWLSSSFAGRIVRSNGIKVLGAPQRSSISSMF